MRFLLLLLLCLPIAAHGAATRYGYTSPDHLEEPIYNSATGADDCGTSDDCWDLSDLTADQTVTVAQGNWNTITTNTSDNVFVVEPGDHTGKGKLTLNFGGSADTVAGRNWLICLNGDDEMDPTPSILRDSADRCTITEIKFNTNSDYWVFHGFTVIPDGGDRAVDTGDTTNEGDHVILNGLLVECDDSEDPGGCVTIRNSEPYLIQNSVVRNCPYSAGNNDASAITVLPNRDDGKILNNEIIDCADNLAMSASGTNDFHKRTVVDNNDLYYTEARRIPCDSGLTLADALAVDCTTETCNCVCGEQPFADVKGGGTAGNVLTFSNNRSWGSRRGDSVQEGACGASGDESGDLFKIHSGGPGDTPAAQFIDFIHNDLWDCQRCITLDGNFPDPDDITIEGNLISEYDEWDVVSGRKCVAIELDATVDRALIVGNTIINPQNPACQWINRGSAGADIQCNVIGGITGGLSVGGSLSAGTEDYNAWWGDFDTTPPGANTVEVSIDDFQSYSTWIMRWTNPTLKTFENAQHLPDSDVTGLCAGATFTSGFGVD